jgi:hypothetical protein
MVCLVDCATHEQGKECWVKKRHGDRVTYSKLVRLAIFIYKNAFEYLLFNCILVLLWRATLPPSLLPSQNQFYMLTL